VLPVASGHQGEMEENAVLFPMILWSRSVADTHSIKVWARLTGFAAGRTMWISIVTLSNAADRLRYTKPVSIAVMARYLQVRSQIIGRDVINSGRNAMGKFIIQTPRVVVTEPFMAGMIRVAATGISYPGGAGLTVVVNVSTRTGNPAVLLRRIREQYTMEHRVVVQLVLLKSMERTAGLLQANIMPGVQMGIVLKCILAIYPALPGEHIYNPIFH
jgi:hypothetical protein